MRELEVAIPAILETTAGTAERLKQTLRGGQRHFVLTARDGSVSALVRLAAPEDSASEHRLAGHRVTIDWTRSIVSTDRASVTISRTELRLLAVLLEADGQAVSRRDLMERVWPERPLDIASRENGLAVYVCTLRKRLGSVGLGSAVVTVRKKGYLVARD
jgi:DNA-binding winged helix-turn-helix (wHTH) protein